MTTSFDRARLLALLLVPVALACSDGSPPTHPDEQAPGSDLGVSSQAIQNGVQDTNNLARSVIFVRGSGATGFVVGPRMILTAAHLGPNAVTGCDDPSALSPFIPYHDPVTPFTDSEALTQVGGQTGIGGGFYHPDSYVHVKELGCADDASCTTPTCHPKCIQGKQEMSQDRRHDMALLLTVQRFPASIPALPILLHDKLVGKQRVTSAVRKVPFTELQKFVATKPKVTIAGYGGGNSALPSPTVNPRSRNLGITTLLALTPGPIPPSPTGCSSTQSVENSIMVRSAPQGLDMAMVFATATGSFSGGEALEDGVNLPPGTPEVPNLESWGSGGDSGGPLLWGAGFSVPGLPGTSPLESTPLPDEWVQQGWVQPGEVVVAGVFSSVDALIPDDNNPNTPSPPFPPNNYHAATFEPSNTLFLLPFFLDADGDDEPDVTDPCPNDPDNRDPDGDGLVGKCDPFPCSPHAAGQPDDADGDGIADVCDATLVDPANGDAGFCQAYCASHPADPCPNTAGSNYNGNARSELARQAFAYPDACDPVTYPGVSTPEVDVQQIGVPIITPVSTSNGVVNFVSTATYRTLAETIELDLVGSHYSPAAAPAGTLNAGKEEPVLVDETHLRVCLDAAVNCGDPAAFDQDLLTKAPSAGAEQLDQFWHRITLKKQNVLAPGTPAAGDPLKNLSYQQGSWPTVTWNWKADYQRWTTTWGANPLTPLTTPTNPGDGGYASWAHGTSLVGMDEQANPYGTGFHPSLLDPSHAATKISNAYTSATLHNLSTRTKPSSGTLLTFPRKPLLLYPCPTCPETLGLPQDPGYPVGLWRDFGQYERNQARVLVQTATSPAVRGLLRADGSLEDIDASLGQGLRDSLAQDTRWASQAEPSALMGRGASLPSLVGLSPDGTRLTERVYLRGGKVLGQRDLGRLAGGAAPRLAAQALATTTDDGPPPRQDFESVYSRSTGRVFVLGGKDPATQQPRRDVWWTFVDGDSWIRVTTSFQPEQVVSATFSMRDGRLWVLDRRTVAGQPTMRLTRLLPETGEAQTLGEWPVAGWFDQHWLVTDRDGSVLVVASSSKPDKHLIVRLTAGAQVQVDGVYGGNGRFVVAPVVDEEGYWLVTAKNKQAPERTRLASLTLKGAGWAQLGGCW